MPRFVQSLLLASLIWGSHASRGAAEVPAPETFAERWVVVLGSSENARAAENAAARRGVHVLHSDRFAGMTPGYYVMADGPFEAFADAQRVAAQLLVRGPAYVKFTGAWRPEGPANPEKAGTTSSTMSAAGVPGPAFSMPAFLSEPQRAALERWRLVSQRITGWNARYEILGVFKSVSDPTNSILVHERVSVDGGCEEGYRELQFVSRSDQPAFSSARVLGHRCCALERCSYPGPGDLMLQLLQDPQDAGWAIDAATGVLVDDPPHGSKRLRAADVEHLGSLLSFDPTSDSFECQADWKHGVARCFKYSAGQGYDFVWVKRNERAVLERIVTAYRK